MRLRNISHESGFAILSWWPPLIWT